MHLFSNEFSVLSNDSRNEVLISFFQNLPDVKDLLTGEKELHAVSEVVSQIVMTKAVAKNLLRTLSDALQEQESIE